MARNVGSIEVTVDANTGKLKAQIVKASEEAGAAGARRLSDELGDIDTTEALNRVRALKAQIEEQLATLDDLELGMDASEVYAELKRINASIAVMDPEINVGLILDKEKFKAELKAFEDSQALDELAITLDPDFTEINRLIKAWRQKEENNDLELEVHADVIAARAELDELRRQQGLDDLEVRLDLAIEFAQAQIDTFIEQNPEIDVTLNPQIARLQETIAGLELEKAEINVELALQTARADREADQFRAKQEADELAFKASLTDSLIAAGAEAVAWKLQLEEDEINFKADLTTALVAAGAEAVAWKLQLEEDEINFKASLTDALVAAGAEAVAWKAQLEEDEIDFQVEMHTALAKAEGEAFIRDLEALDADIQLNLHTANALLQASNFKKLAEADRINVRTTVEANLLAAIQARDAMALVVTDIGVDLEPHFDETNAAIADTEAKLNAWGTGAGDAAGKNMAKGTGDGFSGSLGDSLQDGGKIMVAIVAGFGADLAPLVNAAIGTITEIASSAAFAVAGAAAFGLVAIAGLGAAAGATVVGLSGFGGAIKTINDEFAKAKETQDASKLQTALGNLAPNATNAALAFRDIRGALGESRTEIQQELFSGFGGVIDTFANTTLPNLTSAAKIAAGDVNDLVTKLATLAEDTDWTGIMKAVDPTVDNIFSVGLSIMETLEPLLLTAAPAAEKISGYLSDIARDFSTWVNTHPDELTTFFDHGATSLLLWLGLIGSIGGLMGTVFGAGRGPGDTFVAKLDETITKWNEWLNTDVGQTALSDFFTDANQTLLDLDPVIQGLKDFVAAIQPDDGGAAFAETMQALGDALPAVAEGLQLMSGLSIGRLLLRSVDLFGRLAEEVNKLPDPLLEVVGVAYLAVKAFGPMEKAVEGVSKAINLLGKASTGSIVLAGLTAALAAGLFVWDQYKGKQEAVERRTNTLSEALRDAGDAALENNDGMGAATLGLESFNEALLAGDEGAKLRGNLEDLGISAGQTRETLMKMATDPVAELTRMAGHFGVTGDAAHLLGSIVHATNDNFGHMDEDLKRVSQGHRDVRDEVERLSGSLGHEQFGMERLMDITGLSKDALQEYLTSAEHVEDQVDENNVVLEQMAQSELAAAAAGDLMHRSALAQAAAQLDATSANDYANMSLTDIGNTLKDSVPLYDLYMQKLAEQQAEQAAVEAGNLSGLSAQEQINDQIELGIAAQRERDAAIKEAHHTAFEAWKTETRAAKELADAEAEVAAVKFGDWGITEDVARGFGELGDQIRDAADAASDFQDVYDTLFGGTKSWMGAVSDVEAAADDFSDLLDGVSGKADENSETMEGWSERVVDASNSVVDAGDHVATGFNLMNEAGRTLQDKAFAYADAIIGIGKSGIEGGKGVTEITNEMMTMREQMQDNLVEFGFSEEAAADYINTLLGTPESMRTIVENPGLLEAMLNVEDLTLLYDDAGQPIITEFETLGIDPALVTSQQFVDLLNEVAGTHIEPQVLTSDIIAASEKFRGVQNQADRLDGTTSHPQVFLQGITPAEEAGAAVHAQMAVLDEDEANPYVNPDSINAATTAAQNTDAALTNVGNQAPAPVIDTEGITPAEEAARNAQAALQGTEGVYVPSIITDDMDPGIDAAVTAQQELDKVDKTKAEPTIDIPSQILAMVLLAVIHTELTTINDMIINPTIALPDYPNVTTQLFTLSLKLALLSAYTAHPHVKLDNYDTVKNQLDTLQTEMNGLSGMVSSPEVRLDGYQTVMQQIDNIQINMGQIQDHTATIHVNTVTSTTAQSMTGSIVGHDQMMRVGERGYAEAIIPLQLPLNRVSPEVREMAALLRGESPAQRMGSGKVSRLPSPINQYFTLTSADPEAVAVQTLNRAAAMVGG